MEDYFVRKELRQKLATSIIAKEPKVVVYTTGAGSLFPDLLWKIPGASKVFLDFQMPYHTESFKWVVEAPLVSTGKFSFASKEAALTLAQAAFYRAQRILMDTEGDLNSAVGVGLAAAAPTDRTLRGGVRMYGVVKTFRGIEYVSLVLNQESVSREEFGDRASELILNLIAHSAGVSEGFLLSDLQNLVISSEGYSENHLSLVPVSWEMPEVSGVNTPQVYLQNGGVSEFSTGAILYPGAFDPWTYGHDRIALTVSELTSKPVVVELTMHHPEKPWLAESTYDRAKHLLGRWPFFFGQQAPMFTDKLRAYKPSGFILGSDTLKRLLDPKYTSGISNKILMLEEFSKADCRFYVVSRGPEVNDLGRIDWSQVDETMIPRYQEMFVGLPGRYPVSSTMVKERLGKK